MKCSNRAAIVSIALGIRVSVQAGNEVFAQDHSVVPADLSCRQQIIVEGEG